MAEKCPVCKGLHYIKYPELRHEINVPLIPSKFGEIVCFMFFAHSPYIISGHSHVCMKCKHRAKEVTYHRPDGISDKKWNYILNRLKKIGR